MYSRPLVPADFAMPQRLDGNGFLLRIWRRFPRLDREGLAISTCGLSWPRYSLERLARKIASHRLEPQGGAIMRRLAKPSIESLAQDRHFAEVESKEERHDYDRTHLARTGSGHQE